MSLDMPATLPAVAVEWAELVQLVSTVSPKEAMDGRVAASFGEIVTSAYYPRGPERPAWYHAATAGQYVMVIEGCNNLFQGYATVNGYLGHGLGLFIGGTHPYYEELANLIIGSAGSLNMLAGRAVYLAGHSLGGAVAIQVHRKLLANARNLTARTVTFGSPKAGLSSEMLELERATVVRWMNHNDPVPLVFPNVADCPALLLSLGQASIRRSALFRQPPGGVQLDATGNTSPQLYPQDATINATGNLAAWLLAIEQNRASPHDLTAYIARLDMWTRNHPQQIHVQAVVNRDRQDADQPNNRELTKAERQVFQVFRAQEIAQRATKLVMPPARLVTVERHRPFYRVVWQGDVIAVVTLRATANGIARDLNGFLRRIQVAGVVDSEHISAAFTSYLAAAQVGGGFAPAMKTTIPEVPTDLP